MQDRQKFEKTVLNNGIEIYAHAMDVPFFNLHVIFPVGSAHSHPANGGEGGVAHFLEHMAFIQSKKYPKRHSFENLIYQYGGDINATTYSYQTDYYLEAPAENFAEAFYGQCDQVFSPIFKEEEIAIQRGIIANERNQRKYYPARTELGQYLATRWMWNRYYSAEQLFGSNEDLANSIVETFTNFHQNYFTKDVKVVVGGNFDLKLIVDYFEKLEVKDQTKLLVKVEEPKWVNKNYHEHHFRDIDTPSFWYGNILSDFDLETDWAIGFIGEYLTNYGTGALSRWLRKEKGWTYGLRFMKWYDIDRLVWKIEFPLNELDHVKDVRENLQLKIKEALADKEAVSKEVDRRLKERLFFYQTLTDRMDAGVEQLTSLGCIPTEAEYIALTEKCRDVDYLNKVYEAQFSESVCGEFLALPEVKIEAGTEDK